MSVQPVKAQRHQNFNSGWNWAFEEEAGQRPQSKGTDVTLPHAWNQHEAFCKPIAQLSDSVVWYRKSFSLNRKDIENKKVFIEFEGVRQAGEFYLNGHYLGIHENGVMAVGFDLTPYIISGKNTIEVRTDNDWRYHEKSSGSVYQWNDRNFNANYGGIPKNVWLHIVPQVYQTLPLYSNLRTTGTYVYATDMDIPAGTATINVETQVRNDSEEKAEPALRLPVPEGLSGTASADTPFTLAPGETRTITASIPVSGIDWWSWGHGALYDVNSIIVDKAGQEKDCVTIRTGFRKTRYAEGKIWLNDRVIQMKGFAQRTSNEWPGVGMSIPAWLSDYSNSLMVSGGANLVRWMHVTPWKQDIESCDRVGLIQAMPAGDGEKDVVGERWRQRTELMRDAIIYNRNNPSILFYEGGNESISREHMLELKAIRDQYDPHGGRAIGSREMLDIDEAEYGGEMLYINKSHKHPMWAMEYSRDEGLRKYWDAYSYPYHREGAGPLYRNQGAEAWNHNMDMLAVEGVRRWYDYWQERPGTGTRVSSGGVKIIFSDTNTHCRGEENYRRSGVTDAMRIPKDAFYAHQVMWNGWVDGPELNDGDKDNRYQTHIIGHWNYAEAKTRYDEMFLNKTKEFSKPVYVVSNAERVELLLNSQSLGEGKRSSHFLFTFDDVQWQKGTLTAVSYDKAGKEVSRHTIKTAGEPAAIRLKSLCHDGEWRTQGSRMYADGADMSLIEYEIIDAEGNRCPLDNRPVSFTVSGPATWIGGIAQNNFNAPGSTTPAINYSGETTLPVECGINRALIQSQVKSGTVTITARADGLPDAEIRIVSEKGQQNSDDLMASTPFRYLHSSTPSTPSYVQTKEGVTIVSAQADASQETVGNAYDDNELSEWKGGREITFTLAEAAPVSDVCIKLTGWRTSHYPIEVSAQGKVLFSGITDTSLGYVHLRIAEPVKSDTYTIRLLTSDRKLGTEKVEAELAGGKASELDQLAGAQKALRIVEVEFLRDL